MKQKLDLKCHCGSLTGELAFQQKNICRVVCYCDDCQKFAEYLGSENTLNRNGGTEIIQLSPACLTINVGIENLACLKLTEKGPLRWYADCCKTPVGNTAPRKGLPFLGLIHTFVDWKDQSIDEVIGTKKLVMMTKFSKGGLSESGPSSPGFSIPHVFSVFFKVLFRRILGHHKRSIFFESDSGSPVRTPELVKSA